MKSFLALIFLSISPMVLADSISVPCEFKEGRGARESFELQGQRSSNGAFQASGTAGDVNVNLSFDYSVGRTLVVSYYHDGANLQLSNSRSGTGTIEYKRGLLSRALGAPRDITVTCHPQNIVASQRVSRPEVRVPVQQSRIISDGLFAEISPIGSSEIMSKRASFSVQEGVVVAVPDRSKPYCRATISNPNIENNFEGEFEIVLAPQGSILTASLKRKVGADNQMLILICFNTPSIESLQETMKDMLEIKSSEE